MIADALILEHINEYLMHKDEGVSLLAERYLELRKQVGALNAELEYNEDGYKKTREQNKELIEIANKMAQILSDGEEAQDANVRCVDYFHARDAVYELAEIMEKYGKEI